MENKMEPKGLYGVIEGLCMAHLEDTFGLETTGDAEHSASLSGHAGFLASAVLLVAEFVLVSLFRLHIISYLETFPSQ